MNTNRRIQGLRPDLRFDRTWTAWECFFWWVPLGMVMSLSGLRVIDCVSARRRSLDYGLSIAELLVCAAALALNIAIAVLALQIITVGSSP